MLDSLPSDPRKPVRGFIRCFEQRNERLYPKTPFTCFLSHEVQCLRLPTLIGVHIYRLHADEGRKATT